MTRHGAKYLPPGFYLGSIQDIIEAERLEQEARELAKQQRQQRKDNKLREQCAEAAERRLRSSQSAGCSSGSDNDSAAAGAHVLPSRRSKRLSNRKTQVVQESDECDDDNEHAHVAAAAKGGHAVEDDLDEGAQLKIGLGQVTRMHCFTQWSWTNGPGCCENPGEGDHLFLGRGRGACCVLSSACMRSLLVSGVCCILVC